MKKSNIYTKKGDTGTSCLTDQVRRPKSDPVFEVLGQLDELNARISDSLLAFGMVPRDRDDKTIITLRKVQHALFDIGSEIAGADIVVTPPIEDIENEIDKLDALCPPLHNFILPGGCAEACKYHLCRTQTRACERALVAYSAVSHKDVYAFYPFINRLSDYFFVLARHANATSGVADVLHIQGKLN